VTSACAGAVAARTPHRIRMAVPIVFIAVS
jgi:hypothetical protein